MIREQARFCCCHCCSCFRQDIVYAELSPPKNPSLRPVSPGDDSKTPCWRLSGAALSGFLSAAVSPPASSSHCVAPDVSARELQVAGTRRISRVREPFIRAALASPCFVPTHAYECQLLGIISGRKMLRPLLSVGWCEDNFPGLSAGGTTRGLLSTCTITTYYMRFKSGFVFIFSLRTESRRWKFLPVGGFGIRWHIALYFSASVLCCHIKSSTE